MSIQLKLGGHSFSEEMLRGAIASGAEQVVFVVDTAKVTLVPHEEFDNALAERYLSLCGMECSADECTVCSDMRADVVAVMAINRVALESIVAALGTRAAFTSPLLADTALRQGISLHLTVAVCYVTAWQGGRRLLAEAVPTVVPTDVLYLTAVVAKENFGGVEAQPPIVVRGEQCAAIAKQMRKYFKSVKCE